MSLVRHDPSEAPGLAPLKDQIQGLKNQMASMESEHKQLQRNYEQSCSQSLEEALSDLLKLSEVVYKADKNLVFWVEKGAPLRLLLRPLGIDKKATTIVSRKTAKLKNEVAKVEQRFGVASETCKDALSNVQALNRRITHFSLVDVGAAKDSTNKMIVECDQKKHNVKVEIAIKELASAGVNGNIKETNEGISRNRQATTRTETYRDNATGLAAGGFFGAVLLGGAALMFPPVALGAGLFAGGSALLGTVGAVDSHAKNGEVQRLNQTHRELSTQLQGLQQEITALRQHLIPLERQQSLYTSITLAAKELETGCNEMRCDATRLSVSMMADRQRLTSARLKTEKIATDLKNGEYAQTRREIGTCLLEIVQDICQVVGTCAKVDGQKLKKAQKLLGDIQAKTPKVLAIVSGFDNRVAS